MREEPRLRSQAGKQRHRRQLTVLIAFCAALIIIAALEAALLAGPEAFKIWQELFPETGAGDYSAFILTRFLLDVLVPVSLSLYTYFTIDKFGTPRTYRIVWGGVVLSSAMWKFLALETSSLIWYLVLALWAGLFLIVINIHRLKQEYEKKEGAHEVSNNRL